MPSPNWDQFFSILSHYFLSAYFLPLHIGVLVVLSAIMISSLLHLFRAKCLGINHKEIEQKPTKSLSNRIKPPISTRLFFYFFNFLIIGYFIQYISFATTKHLLSFWVYLIPTASLAVFLTWFVSDYLQQVQTTPDRIDPKHNKDAFIGRTATITRLATEHWVEARLRDQYGQIHNIQINSKKQPLQINDNVMIVDYDEQHFIIEKIP